MLTFSKLVDLVIKSVSLRSSPKSMGTFLCVSLDSASLCVIFSTPQRIFLFIHVFTIELRFTVMFSSKNIEIIFNFFKFNVMNSTSWSRLLKMCFHIPFVKCVERNVRMRTVKLPLEVNLRRVHTLTCRRHIPAI